MTDFIDTAGLLTRATNDHETHSARVALARRSQSVADYGRLCQMVLDDDQAVERYYSWLASRS